MGKLSQSTRLATRTVHVMGEDNPQALTRRRIHPCYRQIRTSQCRRDEAEPDTPNQDILERTELLHGPSTDNPPPMDRPEVESVPKPVEFVILWRMAPTTVGNYKLARKARPSLISCQQFMRCVR